jgi:hypothetical protein
MDGKVIIIDVSTKIDRWMIIINLIACLEYKDKEKKNPLLSRFFYFEC